jgi:hypothetical protein
MAIHICRYYPEEVVPIETVKNDLEWAFLWLAYNELCDHSSSKEKDISPPLAVGHDRLQSTH